MNHPEPGAEIHHHDPFATPEQERSSARRLRGRLAAAVTLWTAGGVPEQVRGASTPDGRVAPMAGLTVSSTVLADGDPPRLLGLLDEESQLLEVIRESGRFAVVPLGPRHRQLADRFAGLMPAPGGLFTGIDWDVTPYGPVLPAAATWAGARVDTVRPYGWGMLVEATVAQISIGNGDAAAPLIHYRGRYRELG